MKLGTVLYESIEADVKKAKKLIAGGYFYDEDDSDGNVVVLKNDSGKRATISREAWEEFKEENLTEDTTWRKHMLLTEIFNTNMYFKVLKPIKVWALTGYKPSNHYYGSARIQQPQYKEVELETDDEIHYLVGGIFAVQLFNEDNNGNPGYSEKVWEVRLREPEDFSPFEKKPMGWNDQSNVAKQYVSSKNLEMIPNGKQTQVKYR